MKALLISTWIYVYLALCGVCCDDVPSITTVPIGGDHLEGPHWSSVENVLYFVDITGQKVHRIDPLTGDLTTRDIDSGPVSPVVTVKDNEGLLLICVKTELFFVKWGAPDGDNNMRLLTAIDLGLPDNRCNDGKVDPKGRLWLGTIGNEVNENVDPDQATLYMIDDKNYLNPKVAVRPVTVSNGLAWSKDSKSMFYIDTPTRNIDVFDFDVDTGIISNRNTLFNVESKNLTGYPDGMTIDSDDNLWIALYNGGKVIKVDSKSGDLLEQYDLPASKITSCTFGDEDLSTLYVTSSKRGLSEAELEQEPDAGSLFALYGTGATGRPENQFSFENAANY